MKNLFAVGMNSNGFYVYPQNLPPASNEPTGDETDFFVADELRSSLNGCVANYIAQMLQDCPHETLLGLTQHHGLPNVLEYIKNVAVILDEG